MPQALRQHWTTIALALILLAAGAMRLYNIEFDQNTGQHPDERHISGTALTQLSWTQDVSLEHLLDPRRSPLNVRVNREEGTPYGYSYGTLPIYMARLAGATFLNGLVGEGQYGGYTLIGRRLAGIFDLITVLLVFLIARRLYGKMAGVLAALFSAFAVTHIQIAHFFIAEPFLVTFMTATLYFSVVLMQTRAWWAATLAGLMLGLALATKVSVAPLALVIVAALVLRAVYRRRTRRLGPPAELDDPYGLAPATAAERSVDTRGAIASSIPLLVLAAATTLAGLLIGDPFAVLDSGLHFSFGGDITINGTVVFALAGFQVIAEAGKYLHHLGGEAAIQRGVVDMPFTLQYVGRTPFLDNIQQVVTWGLGPPLGLVAVAGVVYGGLMALRRRPAEILLLSGVIPYYISIGVLLTKWMRYMLPVVPYLCILAAALLAQGLAWSLAARAEHAARSTQHAARSTRLRRWGFPVVTGIAVLGSVLWATAFFRIYTEDHSRVQAARWAHNPRNVPSEAMVTKEDWDDPLRNSHVAAFYLYNFRPSHEAFQYIYGVLDEVDYVMINSNRLYMSIPRLPWRYPVQTRFYELLFQEKLGYELVYTKSVYPQIFGVDIVDDYADESFTVYDHPKVLVFKKTRSLSEDEMRTMFGEVINRPAIDSRQGTNLEDKSIMLPQPVGEQIALGDYAWNPLAQNQWVALLLLLVAVQVIGLAAWPLVAIVCRRLPDRGYPLAKMVGLMIVSWLVWMLASLRLIPFTVWSILLGIVVLGVVSALIWRRFQGELRAVWAQQRRLILAWEALFLVAFAFFVLIRLLNPDLWQPWFGGEKPMEFGFLNAVLRSPWMPPHDPFFSSGSLNYYYHGYFMLAVLMKLVGLQPAVGFNLAIALLYGFTALGAGSLVYNAIAVIQRARGWRSSFSPTAFGYAVLGVVLLQLIGNLSYLVQFISMRLPAVHQLYVGLVSRFGPVPDEITRTWGNFDWWWARSVTSKPGSTTINEWPYWTFLFADLHPHLINMCFTLLVLGLALNLLLGAWRWPLFRAVPLGIIETQVSPYPAPGALAFRGGRGVYRAALIEALGRLWGSDAREQWLRFVVTALALGTLFVVNSWDYVTYAGVVLGTLLVALLLAWTSAPARATPIRLAALASAGVSTIAVAGAGLLLYLPFLISFKALYSEIRTITDPSVRTDFAAFMVVWGLFIFLALSYLGLKLRQYPWQAGFEEIRGWVSPRRPAPIPAPAAADPAGTLAASTGPDLEPTMPVEAAPAVARGVAAPIGAVTGRAGTGGNGVSAEDRFDDGFDDYGLEDAGALGASLDEAELARYRRPVASNVGGGDGSALHGQGITLSDEGDYLEEEIGERRADGAALRRSIPLETPRRDHVFTMRVPRRATEAGGDSSVPGGGASDGDVQAPAAYQDESAPAHGQWIEDVSDDNPPADPPRRPGVYGLVPPGAGILILGLTGLLTLWLALSGSPLLALLGLIIGGLIGTHFGAVRNPGALFGGMLLVVAAIVALGVELVYLADHLRDSEAFRMNTVFKFYMQAWVLFASGSAVAVYWLIGPKGIRRSAAVAATSAAGESEEIPAWNSPEGAEIADAVEEASTVESAPGEVRVVDLDEGTPREVQDREPRPYGAERGAVAATAPARGYSQDGAAELSAASRTTETHTAAIAPAGRGPVRVAREPAQWTWPRMAWLAVFSLLLAGSLIFTVAGTQGRVADRMPGTRPPFGTLDGGEWMNHTTLNLAFDDNQVQGPIVFRLEREALTWLNETIKGNPVIAAGPREYYREGGMIVGTYTGLPMVVGGLHQNEQRYDWQVAERRGDMNAFFREDDTPRALAIISKYDVEYIYIGQIERTVYGPSGGLAKFDDLVRAGPDGAPVLEVLFDNGGVKIYRVLPGVEQQVGAEPGAVRVQPTPRPRPTDPPMEDDPKLKILLATVASDPDNADAHNALADYYRERGALVKAAEQYEEVIRLRPNNVSAHHILGDIYFQLGEQDRALAIWQRAADNADPPDRAPAYNKLGIAYRENGRYDEAIKAFETALQNDPTFVESAFMLGSIYETLGEKDRAIAAYERVLQNARDDESGNGWRARAQERLDDLR